MVTQHLPENRVRVYRRACGLTQRDMAHLLGYKSSNIIHHIELAKGLPKMDVAFTLSLILKQPAAVLFHNDYQAVQIDLARKAARYYESTRSRSHMSPRERRRLQYIMQLMNTHHIPKQ